MNFKKEKELLCRYGLKLMEAKLTPGTSGNLSIFDPESKTVLITPSGVPYTDLKPEQIVEMDLDANVLSGDYKPSSEYHLHTLMYKNKPEARAIIHAHSFYSTALGILNQSLKAVHYVIAEAGTGEVPLAPYKLMGTKELAEACVESIGNSRAVLMKNHGITVYGKDLSDAFSVLRNCEWCAKLQLTCQSIGPISYLSNEEIDDVLEAFKDYGQVKKIR